MKEEVINALAALRRNVLASNALRDSGGMKVYCDAYDASELAENEAYEAMNAVGLTSAEWAEYDRAKREIYAKVWKR